MSSATLPEAAAAYLAALERELADLPADERAELFEEVEASLLEAGDAPGCCTTSGSTTRNGKPLNVGRGAADPNRRPVVNREGARLFNAFPIRYFEAGTDRVAHPNAVPRDLKPQPLR
jgi:hypothetical protein